MELSAVLVFLDNGWAPGVWKCFSITYKSCTQLVSKNGLHSAVLQPRNADIWNRLQSRRFRKGHHVHVNTENCKWTRVFRGEIWEKDCPRVNCREGSYANHYTKIEQQWRRMQVYLCGCWPQERKESYSRVHWGQQENLLMEQSGDCGLEYCLGPS